MILTGTYAGDVCLGAAIPLTLFVLVLFLVPLWLARRHVRQTEAEVKYFEIYP